MWLEHREPKGLCVVLKIPCVNENMSNGLVKEES
jgi:hypothetical protein